MPLHQIWVGCGSCGEIEQRRLNGDVIRANVPGEILPIGCSGCGRSMLIITPPPWVLSERDWMFLRVQRIDPGHAARGELTE